MVAPRGRCLGDGASDAGMAGRVRATHPQDGCAPAGPRTDSNTGSTDLICCCAVPAPTELNLFNTPIPSWVPGAAKRKHLTERLTKLGAEIPDEGEKRYYGFQSYTVNEGMQLHGTLDDIFKDAPKIEEDERAEDHAEEMSELAKVAADVRQCQSQLSQLIRLQGGREQAPAANGTHASSPDRRAREDQARRSSSGRAPSEGESDGEGAGKKVKPKKRRPRSIVAPPGGVGPPGDVAPPDGVEPTWRLHVT